jgi:hypothetical protein
MKSALFSDGLRRKGNSDQNAPGGKAYLHALVFHLDACLVETASLKPFYF